MARTPPSEPPLDDTGVIEHDGRVLDVWDDAGEERVVVEEAAPPPPGRHQWWWLLALALAAVAALVGWLVYQNLDQDTASADPTRRAVPNVVGMQVDRAVDRLHELGFTTDVRRRRTSDRDEGTVLEQRPTPGTRLEDGGEVLVVAAGGPRRVRVPSVTGMPLQEAVERLDERELEARPRSVFADEPRGRVVRQLPAAERRVEEGTTVRLDVSKGPQRVAVPDVVGMTAAEAASALRAAGFEAKPFEVPAEEPRGTVVAQSPLGGANAARGDAVRINVSSGPPQPATGSGSSGGSTTTAPAPKPQPRRVTMPSLVGQDVGEASRRLREFGLVVRVEYVPSQEPQGTVVAQRPAAGTSVPRGSQVRLNASEGPRPGARRPVPDVVGLTEEEATEELERAGYEVEVVDEPTPDPAEEGVVVRQEPEAGMRAPRGALITLYVGRVE